MKNNQNRKLSQGTANCVKSFNKMLEMNTEAERRKIASMMAQGILANDKTFDNLSNEEIRRFPKTLAIAAVNITDALIAELNKTRHGSTGN